ncbi:MAG: methyltransferase [Dermatophilaceae bacterium]
MSRAGMALGEFLHEHLAPHDVAGRVLDLGTGSGVIALLLRSLGAASITATDVSARAIETARHNELLNFPDARIDFQEGNLFEIDSGTPAKPFDLVVFNPPGWRTPSPSLKRRLSTCQGALELDSMFYGETVLATFLRDLPYHLTPRGRAIVGFNSLLGMRDVLAPPVRAGMDNDRPRLRRRLLRRVELPLLLYTDEWAAARDELLQEIRDGGRQYGAEYVMRDQTLYWYYDITELTVAGPTATDRARERPEKGTGRNEPGR